MLRDTSPGALPASAPAQGSGHRMPAGRALVLAALWLASAPLAAQTVRLDASTSFSQPCSSAKAVHDMRCPNYTGFAARVGRSSGTSEPAEADAAASAELVERGNDVGEGLSARRSDSSGLRSSSRLGLRVGRDIQRGVASWYGPGFHGRTTANGEKFDMHELTAAHKTLPFGTRVLVHSPRTGKEVVVRINDRGPYARGRVIDLSKAAASALGLKSVGHDAVVLREVLPGEIAGGE